MILLRSFRPALSVLFLALACVFPARLHAQAAPNAATATGIGLTAFTANWAAVSGASTYRVDVATNAEFTGTLVVNNASAGSALFYAVSGLSPATTYHYRVRAVGTGTSANSNVKAVTTATFLPPLLQPASAISQVGFTVNWATAVGATSYRIDVGTSADFSGTLLASNVTTGGISFAIGSLTPDTTYYYRMRSFGTGTSANSVVGSAQTLPFPAPVASAATGVGQTAFNANWTAVPGATGYRIDVATTADFSGTLIASNVSVTTPGYSVTGLLPTTAYYCRVRATGPATSLNSNVVTVTTPAFLAPVALPASDVNFTSFTANWTRVPGATSYRIDVATTPDFSGTLVLNNVSAASALSQSVTGLTLGTTYYYRVRAVGPITSAHSEVITAATLRYDSVPVAITATDVTHTSFTANWARVPGASTYRIDVSPNPEFTGTLVMSDTSAASALSQSVSGLTPGATYYYRVRSVGPITSGHSNVIAVSTRPPFATVPEPLPATDIAYTSFTANWSRVPEATSYRIDVSANPDFSGTLLMDNLSTASALSQSVSGLAAGTIYYYRVRAVGQSTSASSVPVAVTTRNFTVPPVATEATSVTSGSFTANWTRVPGATSYRLDVATTADFSGTLLVNNLSTSSALNSSVSGLTVGTTYYYRVRAVGPLTTGNSNVVSVVAATTSGAVPTALGATNLTHTSFTANWTRVTGATGYYVDLATTPEFSPGSFVGGLQNNSVGTVTHILTNSYSAGLIPGQIYYYRIRATIQVITHHPDGSTTTSETFTGYSNVVSVTTPIFTGVPVAQAATKVLFTSFTANWAAVPDATSYYVDVATSSDFTSGAMVSGLTNISVGNVLSVSTASYVSGLTPGVVYYYRVRALGPPSTLGENSNVVSVTTAIFTGIPQIQAATKVSFTSFTANWQAVPEATSYYVDVATNADFSPTSLVAGLVNISVGNVTSFSTAAYIAGLTPGTVYHYRVRAAGPASSLSHNSSSVNVTTAIFSGVPVGGSATKQDFISFTANWSAVPEATSYYVDVATSADFATETMVAGLSNISVGNVTRLSTASYVAGLMPGTTYHYRVRAAGPASALSANSNPISVTTLIFSGTPAAHAASALSPTGFTANWSPLQDAVGYLLDVATSETFDAASIVPSLKNVSVGNVTKVATSSYTAGLVTGTTYYYRVRANGPNSQVTPYSNVVTTTTYALPIITTQPAAQVASVGAEVSLTVGATGIPAPTYQWRKNGVDLPGATSATLALASAQVSDSGSYSAVLSHPAAVLTSNPATLSVVAPTDSGYVFSTLAGLARTGGTPDGTGSGARFTTPWGVARDAAGFLYVTDSTANTVRKISPAGVATTLAGFHPVAGSDDGVGPAARFNAPRGLALDAGGNLFVADSNNNTIRRVTPSGEVTTFAGFAGSSGATDGAGIAARFANPRAVAVDGAGIVYVADTTNHTLRRITPEGVVTTLAGTAGVSGTVDATGAAARFNGPTGLALDGAGHLFVADQGSHVIRKVVLSSGAVTTVAGSAGLSGGDDGTGSGARFHTPVGLAVDSSGRLYVADFGGHTLRRISAAGVVTTIGGLYGSTGFSDGAGSAARFNQPAGLAIDAAGNLYVADNTNAIVRLGSSQLAEPPVIATQPVAQSVNLGQTVVFSVVATGSPAPTYQWWHGGGSIAGATNATLTLTNVQLADAGTYTVVVSNAVGTVTSAVAALTVTEPPVLPAITTAPADRVANAGTTVTFSVLATGTPAPTYQWRKTTTPIGGATSATLTLTDVQPAAAGSYNVVVTNSAGSVTSAPANLAVVSPPVALAASNVTSVSFTANFTPATGATFAGHEVFIATNPQMLGALGLDADSVGSHTFTGLAPGTTYYFRVQALVGAPILLSSDFSATLSVTTLSLPVPTVITTPPLAQTVTAGSSATFNVVASGQGTLTYQWMLNGTAISGATASTYLVVGATLAQSGSAYTVVVTGGAGSVESPPAFLTVQAAGTTVLLRDTFSLNAATGRTVGADLDGKPVETAASGTPVWSSKDLYQGGTNTFAGTDTAGYIALNSGHHSALAAVPMTLTAGQNYYLRARVYPGSLVNATDTFKGFLSLGFYRRASGGYLTDNTRVLDFVMFQDRYGLLTVNTALVGGGTITAFPAYPSGAPGWSAGTPALVEIIWSTTANTLTAKVNGVVVINALSLSGLGVNPADVSHVGFGRDLNMDAHSVVDDFEFGTMSAVGPAAPVISSAGTATGVVGTAFSYAITASGSPTAYGATGLPAGLAVDTATGIISGTPTTTAELTVVLSATNAAGTGTQNLALTIGAPPPVPIITSAATATATVGTAFSYQITAHNFPTSFTATGLPAGLSLDPTSGLISGTPTAAGTSAVALSATNAIGTGTATLALTVNAPLAPPTVVLTAPTNGTSFVLGGAVSLSANAIVGEAPATIIDVQFLADTTVIATDSGAPYAASWTPSSAGTYSLTARATDSNGLATTSAAAVVTIVAPLAPTITTQPVARTVALGQSATFNVVATGTPAPTFQWRKDNVSLVGATQATHTIASVQPVDVGTYTVDVTNSVGSVTSSGAALSVPDELGFTFTTLAGSPGVSGAVDGTGAAARFSQPAGLAVDSLGNIFVVDYGSLTVRKVTPAGLVTTFAGLAGSSGNVNGVGSAARFVQPSDLTIDAADNLFVVDTYATRVRKITPDATVSTYKTGFYLPYGVALDAAGNMFVSDGNSTIAKVTPDGALTTLAGLAGSGGTIDGTGSSARFDGALGLAVDGAGNLWLAEWSSHTVRRVTPAGVVTTVAGLAGTSGMADGIGSSARFVRPSCVAVDAAGNVYIGEDYRIRKLTPAGVVTTLGGRPATSGSADGFGTTATFGSVGAIAVNAAGTRLYIADATKHTVRLGTFGVAPTPPTITTPPASQTVAVGQSATFTVAATSDTPATYQWRKNSTAISGATNAALVLASVGYAAAGNYDVVVTNAAGGVTSASATLTVPYVPPVVSLTAPLTGTSFYLGQSITLAATAVGGDVSAPITSVRFLAGETELATDVSAPFGTTWTPSVVGAYSLTAQATDGYGSAVTSSVAVVTIIAPVAPAITAQPTAQTVPSGQTATFSVVATGTPAPTYQWRKDGAPLAGETAATLTIANVQAVNVGAYTVVVTNLAGSVTSVEAALSLPGGLQGFTFSTLAGTTGQFGAVDATGADARFFQPSGLVVDQHGNTFVADSVNRVVRKITPAGVVTTFAGSLNGAGTTDGTGTAARFNWPIDVKRDAVGNFYVLDQSAGAVRKITPDAVVTTFRTGLSNPSGLAVDATGHVYVSNGDHSIVKITPAGVLTAFAGQPGSFGSADGTGSAARFNLPSGLAVDVAGDVWVTDYLNHTVRRITPAGVVTTVAGRVGVQGEGDGQGLAARFVFPRTIATDASGHVYVGDRMRVKKISPTGLVTTLGGKSTTAAGSNGYGTAAGFGNVAGLAVDAAGTLLHIADSSTHTVRLGTFGASPPPPVIVTQPVARTVVTGTNVTFTVVATGSPAPTYQWRRNGVAITAANSASLQLFSVTAPAAAIYDVIVTSAGVEVLSDPVALVVSPIGAPPTVAFAEPASVTTVVMPNSITFSAAAADADGSISSVRFVVDTGTFVFTSFSDSVAPYRWVYTPQTAGTFVVTAIARDNSGNETASAPVTLTVEAPALPAFRVQPVGTTAFVGSTVHFAVQAVGAGGVGYQWRKDGVAISGAFNPTLSVADVQTSATYTVVISNASGSLSSSPAVLTVVPAVAVSPTYVPLGAAAGTSSSIDPEQFIGQRYTLATAQRIVAATGEFSNASGSFFAAVVPLASVTTLPVGTPAEAISFNPGEVVAYRTFSLPSGFNGSYTVVLNYDAPPGVYGIVFGTGLYGTSGGGGMPRYAAVVGSTGFLWSSSPFRWLDAGTQQGKVGVILSESIPTAPTIQNQPIAKTVAVGTGVVLSVTASGFPAPTYQWRKNGADLPGSTGPTLALTNLDAAGTASYSVVVTNSVGSVTSATVVVAVLPAGTAAQHVATGSGYVPGGTVSIANTFDPTAEADELRWQVLLPSGWSLVAESSGAQTKPPVGTTSLLEWIWTTTPPGRLTFAYTLKASASTSGTSVLAAVASIRPVAAEASLQVLVQPDPLSLLQTVAHSADTDRNLRIDLLELTRVIELYNVRFGTVRTGAYAVATTATEDGFAPDATRPGSTPVTLARYHTSDTNSDGRISLVELTRVIELFNTRGGTTRTGAYRVSAGTEDGFAPAP